MLNTGSKFTSKYFYGVVEVLDIKEKENALEVKITPLIGSYWLETWNLAHTHIGFSQGVYKFIRE